MTEIGSPISSNSTGVKWTGSPLASLLQVVPSQELQRQMDLLRELTPHQFNQWRHSPVTEAFLRFLHHYRLELLLQTMERWAAGGVTLQDEQVLRGKIQVLEEVAEMRVEGLREFYPWPDDMKWPEQEKVEERE